MRCSFFSFVGSLEEQWYLEIVDKGSVSCPTCQAVGRKTIEGLKKHMETCKQVRGFVAFCDSYGLFPYLRHLLLCRVCWWPSCCKENRGFWAWQSWVWTFTQPLTGCGFLRVDLGFLTYKREKIILCSPCEDKKEIIHAKCPFHYLANNWHLVNWHLFLVCLGGDRESQESDN